MSSERDGATLREMLRHIELAEKFALGRSYEILRSDLMPLFAIIRCLEVISEASRRLSDELKARHPQIPWRQMAAAGNFYRHEYEDVLPERVWKPYNKICQSCAP
jgi:uncharacterized protein with HEPN domain